MSVLRRLIVDCFKVFAVGCFVTACILVQVSDMGMSEWQQIAAIVLGWPLFLLMLVIVVLSAAA